MKVSEARILVFIDATPKKMHFARMISMKLEIDYAYTLQIMAGMREKGWLSKRHSPASPTRAYHKINTKGQEMIDQAKKLVSGDKQT